MKMKENKKSQMLKMGAWLKLQVSESVCPVQNCAILQVFPYLKC